MKKRNAEIESAVRKASAETVQPIIASPFPTAFLTLIRDFLSRQSKGGQGGPERSKGGSEQPKDGHKDGPEQAEYDAWVPAHANALVMRDNNGYIIGEVFDTRDLCGSEAASDWHFRVRKDSANWERSLVAYSSRTAALENANKVLNSLFHGPLGIWAALPASTIVRRQKESDCIIGEVKLIGDAIPVKFELRCRLASYDFYRACYANPIEATFQAEKFLIGADCFTGISWYED